jgi:hypothetical protein
MQKRGDSGSASIPNPESPHTGCSVTNHDLTIYDHSRPRFSVLNSFQA